jgi:hypothetical protein
MRKTLAILLAATTLVTATAANAEWRDRRDHGPRPGYSGGGNWVAPLVGGLILGGVIASMANQPQYQQYPQPDPYNSYQPVCNRYFVGRDAWGRPVFQTVCQ